VTVDQDFLAVFLAGAFLAGAFFAVEVAFLAGADFLAAEVDLAGAFFAVEVDFLAAEVDLAGAFFAVEVDFFAADPAFLAGADFFAVDVDFFAAEDDLAGAFFAVDVAFFAVDVAFLADAEAAVTVSFGSFLAPETTFLRSCPGVNFGTFFFFVRMVSPVEGLRAVPALRTFLSKEPKPVMATFSPRATSRVMVSRTDSRACAACFLFPSKRVESLSMSCDLFTVFPSMNAWRTGI
jgi:hypothetical protein